MTAKELIKKLQTFPENTEIKFDSKYQIAGLISVDEVYEYYGDVILKNNNQ